MKKWSFDLCEDELCLEKLSGGGSQVTNKKQLIGMKTIITKVVAEQLTDRQREVCMMRFYDRMTLDEIATQLGVNKTTVWRTLGRAKNNIKQMIKYYPN